MSPTAMRMRAGLALYAAALVGFGLSGGSRQGPGHADSSGPASCQRDGCSGVMKQVTGAKATWMCTKCHRPPKATSPLPPGSPPSSRGA